MIKLDGILNQILSNMSFRFITILHRYIIYDNSAYLTSTTTSRSSRRGGHGSPPAIGGSAKGVQCMHSTYQSQPSILCDQVTGYLPLGYSRLDWSLQRSLCKPEWTPGTSPCDQLFAFGIVVSCRSPGSSLSHRELYHWRKSCPGDSPWSCKEPEYEKNLNGHAHGLRCSRFHCYIAKQGEARPGTA